jgi:hypothetical protein
VAVCWAILARLVPRLLDALIDLTDRAAHWWAQRRRAATGDASSGPERGR